MALPCLNKDDLTWFRLWIWDCRFTDLCRSLQAPPIWSGITVPIAPCVYHQACTWFPFFEEIFGWNSCEGRHVFSSNVKHIDSKSVESLLLRFTWQDNWAQNIPPHCATMIYKLAWILVTLLLVLIVFPAGLLGWAKESCLLQIRGAFSRPEFSTRT